MTSNCTRRPKRWLAAIVATALMIPLVASSADTPVHRLAGMVWISPTCAGAQREGDLCRAPLAGVEVRLSESGGRVAATAMTDATGAFVMRAPAGRYRLHVAGASKVRRCPELAISLPMDKSAPVELECDSGMR